MSGADPFSWLGNQQESGGDAREALAENQKMIEEADRQMRELARLFFDVFQQGRGPELLEYLRRRTIEQPLMVASLTIGNDQRELPVNPSEWAYHRNGQNSVVHFIETMIALARLSETEENGNV